MKRDNTKIIDQYLSGELSDEKRVEFETELKSNPELQKELELQRNIYEGAKRASTRNTVKSVGQKHHFIKLTKWIVGGVAIIALIASAVYFSNQINTTSEKESEAKTQPQVELKSKELINNLPREVFTWSGEDTVYLSESGVLISVPNEAILQNGQPYNGKAIIEWQEAVDGATIMKSGLSTMADSNLLETQGMFSFRVQTENGDLLEVDPEVGIYVQVPVDEIKPGMQLYDGEYDKDSIINWVNPKPLEKLPVPVDMSELDFYPEGYEDTLDKLKLSQKKEYRDSLYLACEYVEDSNDDSAEPMKESMLDTIAKEKSTYDKPNLIDDGGDMGRINLYLDDINAKVEETGDKEYRISINIEAKDGYSLYVPSEELMICEISLENTNGIRYLYKTKVINEEDTFKKENTLIIRRIKFEGVTENKKINFSFQIAHKEKGEAYAPICKSYILDFNQSNESNYNHIPPSKVLAFWNEKFNNTILATRDFEKRMHEIHETCDESLLKLYTNNIDMPLYYIDSLAMGRGYKQFESFYAERVGKVEIDDSHMKNLTNIYQKGISALREDLKKQRKEYEKNKVTISNKLIKERVAQAVRASNMMEKTLAEETRFNLKQKPVVNQQTVPASFVSSTALVIAQQRTRSVGFRINNNNAICNVDRKVANATRSRSNFRGSYQGKSIDVKYNDFKLSVDNHSEYSRLYVYLLPDKFNSYQRLNGSEGEFSYRMNDNVLYNVVVIGFNQDEFFYYEDQKISQGSFNKIKLKSIDEGKFEKKIAAINNSRLNEPSGLMKDLNWLKLEKEYYLISKEVIKKNRLLKRMRKVVFPCMSDFNENIIIETRPIEQDLNVSASDEVLVTFPDREPQFPGGAASMKRFLAENINYPEKAMDEGAQGKVFVEFIVEADGSISNVRVIRGVSPEIDSEAIRVVRSMPKWTPPQKNGRNTRSPNRIPINFILGP